MKAKIIVGVLSGVAAGVILGILFAPHKGSKTRRLIAEKGGELTEELKNKFHQFGDFISEKLDSTKGVYSQFIRMGKSKA
ncbi:MAG TPA: YtxH domain-containing protein [Bacteroidales bacterium]|nr:YtxH domain-containing protein [Bacteroidales bacterium]